MLTGYPGERRVPETHLPSALAHIPRQTLRPVASHVQTNCKEEERNRKRKSIKGHVLEFVIHAAAMLCIHL